MKKRILSMLIALVMVIGMIPVIALNASAAEAYNGTPVTPTVISSDTYKQLGMAEDKWTEYNGYYAIRNGAELYGFLAIVEGGNAYANAVLLADVAANAGKVTESGSDSGTTYKWTPIGTKVNYKGTFDGNGHTISGIYFKPNEGVANSHIGLFGTIEGAKIKNIVLANSYIEGSFAIGGIVAVSFRTGSVISNCKVAEDVTIVKDKDQAKPYTGGILGTYDGVGIGFNDYKLSCTINNCVFLGNIKILSQPLTDYAHTRTNIGAIVGRHRKEGNAFSFVVANNCYYKKFCATDMNGNSSYDKEYSSNLDIIAGLGAEDSDRISDYGCTIIASAAVEHGALATTHKGLVSGCTTHGHADYTFCLICNKHIPTVTFTAPSYNVMPGNKINLSADANYDEVTGFTIESGSNYSVNGMTVSIADDIPIGTKIPVTVTSTETANTHSVQATLTLDVIIPDFTDDINNVQTNLDNAVTNLETAINTKADATALNNAVTNLENAIANAQAAAEKFATDADATLKSELLNAIATAKQEAIDAASTALDTAKNELNDAIALKADQTALDTAVTNLETAIANAQTAAEKFATDADAEMKKLIDADIAEANRLIAALDVRVTAAEQAIIRIDDTIAQLRTDVDKNADDIIALSDALAQAKKELEEADAKNRRELEAKIEEGDRILAEAIAALRADLDKEVDKLYDIMSDGLTATADVIANALVALDNVINVTTQALEAADAENKKMLEDALTTAKLTLESAIAGLEDDLEDAIDDLDRAIASGDVVLGAKIAVVEDALKKAEVALKIADAEKEAAIVTKMKKADEATNEAVKALQKSLNDTKADLEANKNEFTNKVGSLQTFIIIVCVISSVALVGSATFVVWFFFFNKKKKIG